MQGFRAILFNDRRAFPDEFGPLFHAQYPGHEVAGERLSFSLACLVPVIERQGESFLERRHHAFVEILGRRAPQPVNGEEGVVVRREIFLSRFGEGRQRVQHARCLGRVKMRREEARGELQ